MLPRNRIIDMDINENFLLKMETVAELVIYFIVQIFVRIKK